MQLEKLVLENFQCFSEPGVEVEIEGGLTSLIGANGAGKTALMQALLRMFGTTNELRRVRRTDFHVGPEEVVEEGSTRSLVIEAIFGFPELNSDDEASHGAVPPFFHHVAAEEDGQVKCRIRLEADFTDDGLDGQFQQRLVAVRTMAASFTEDDCTIVPGAARSAIQVVYVPALRNASSQVSSLLRGRVWKAINWSGSLPTTLQQAASDLGKSFGRERGVKRISRRLVRRWHEIHAGGMEADPGFRPIDSRLEDFVRNVRLVLDPDETGRERDVDELSDGQRSLLSLALTSATLDIERQVTSGKSGFKTGTFAPPSLTLVCVEEPENNLAPFYLSRIVRQLQSSCEHLGVQALISSHSASVLSRIEPEQVRHFRMPPQRSGVQVRKIRLPSDSEAALKYVREAVRGFPELYFASYVILGEGASEEVVIPKIAEARDIPVDRSFVAVVPLGGRHVNHLWFLLSSLGVAFSTLLDLDFGREGGGIGRIRYAVEQLEALGIPEVQIYGEQCTPESLKADDVTLPTLQAWATRLEFYGVFFSAPLDLDMSMLSAFPDAYQRLEPGQRGPDTSSSTAADVVVGERGNANVLQDLELPFAWYRYLFLNRGKPSSHTRALAAIALDDLGRLAPSAISRLLDRVAKSIPPLQIDDDDDSDEDIDNEPEDSPQEDTTDSGSTPQTSTNHESDES